MWLLAIVAFCFVAAVLHRIDRRIKTMANTIDDKLSALDTATNAVAAEVAQLRTELGNVASPEQLARMDGIAARLTGLAADPADPVPTPPPTAA